MSTIPDGGAAVHVDGDPSYILHRLVYRRLEELFDTLLTGADLPKVLSDVLTADGTQAVEKFYFDPTHFHVRGQNIIQTFGTGTIDRVLVLGNRVPSDLSARWAVTCTIGMLRLEVMESSIDYFAVRRGGGHWITLAGSPSAWRYPKIDTEEETEIIRKKVT